MTEPIHEHDLLDLVEETLDVASAQRLREQLAASDPALAARLDGMIADRAALLAMPDPVTPRELIEDLESILARPMLVDSVPAPPSVRRRRVDLGRRRRLVRAAGIGLVLIAGGALAVTLADTDRRQAIVASLGFGDSAPDRVDADVTAPVTIVDAGDPGAGADAPVWPPESGTIHHRGPIVDPSSRLATADPTPRTPNRDVVLVAAPVKLIVPTDPAHAAAMADIVRATAERMVTDVDHRIAFVSNFSLDEAERVALLERLQGRGRPNAPAVAGTDQASTPIDFLSPTLPTITEADLPRAGQRSAHLAGSRRYAPAYSHQIAFSSAGAAYTITVPASRLNDVLERLRTVTEGRSRLRRLNEADAADAGPFAEYAAVQTALRTLLDDVDPADRDRVLVLLPIQMDVSGR